MSCEHPISKQKFHKMFLNDNGLYGGQAVQIILECDCGYLSHIRSFRGNVAKEYIVPNSGSFFGSQERDEFETEIVHN